MNDVIEKVIKNEEVPHREVVRPQTVQPSPLPTSFNVGQAEIHGQQLVVLQIATPQGQFVFFLDGASAEGLGAILTRVGGASKAGLVVP